MFKVLKTAEIDVATENTSMKVAYVIGYSVGMTIHLTIRVLIKLGK